MRRERFRRFWPAIAVVAFATVTIESASAHDKGCDGNPVPGRDQVGLLRQSRRAPPEA